MNGDEILYYYDNNSNVLKLKVVDLLRHTVTASILMYNTGQLIINLIIFKVVS